MKVAYLDRAGWGARTDLSRRGTSVSAEGREGLVLHHTVGGKVLSGSVDEAVVYVRWLQTGVAARLGADIPYSFVICMLRAPETGEFSLLVCEGRGWNRSGAHTVDTIVDDDPIEGHENEKLFGLGWQGDWRTYTEVLGQYGDPEAMLDDAILSLGAWFGKAAAAIIPENQINYSFGHRDFKATSCPSDGLYTRAGILLESFLGGTEMDPRITDEMAQALSDLVTGKNDFNETQPENDRTSFRGIGRWVTPTIRMHTRGDGLGLDEGNPFDHTPNSQALDDALADHLRGHPTGGAPTEPFDATITPN